MTMSSAPAPALYASGAVLALSFAIAVGLATRFIPLALSLGAAGVVWVGLYRPVTVLAWLASLLAALACHRNRHRPAASRRGDRHDARS